MKKNNNQCCWKCVFVFVSVACASCVDAHLDCCRRQSGLWPLDTVIISAKLRPVSPWNELCINIMYVTPGAQDLYMAQTRRECLVYTHCVTKKRLGLCPDFTLSQSISPNNVSASVSLTVIDSFRRDHFFATFCVLPSPQKIHLPPPHSHSHAKALESSIKRSIFLLRVHVLAHAGVESRSNCSK